MLGRDESPVTAKGGEPDEGGRKQVGNDPGAAGYPLLFKGSSRSGRNGFVAWFLGLFRNPPQPKGLEDQDWAGDVDGPPDPSAPLERDPLPPDATTHGTESTVRNEAPTALGEQPGALGQKDSGTAPSRPPPSPVGPMEPLYGEEEPKATPLHRATLQMLPGRLQPMDRDVLKQEIRFIRPSNSAQEITVGRDTAAPPDHVTLDHPSLAPRHARMQYRDGHWWIDSLTDDDPVRLNDQAIHHRDGRRLLRDGDRVRLGDLEFRFLAP